MKKTIATFTDKDIFPNNPLAREVSFVDRPTVKVIILDEDNKIGLVGNNKNEYFQLPGGGVDVNENILDGAKRECLEETGCNLNINHEIGCIDDYRSRDKVHCISYGYLGNLTGEKGEPMHTEEEKDNQMYVKWFTLTEVLDIFHKQEKDLRDGKVTFYNTGFNIVRDRLFVITAIDKGYLHE